MRAPGAEDRIVIVGGGIGGLTLAIALGRKGRPVTLLERSQFADEAGAGIQLAPNATRILRELDLLDAIAGVSSRPDALCIFDAQSGSKLAMLPLGKEAEARYGAPYLTLRRSDLQASLLNKARDLETIIVKPGFEAESIEETTHVAVHDPGGERVEGTALVGADGLWSMVRRFTSPGPTPRFVGEAAWRALIPRREIPTPFDASIVGLWLAPHAHLVHYPIERSEEINLVLVTEDGAPLDGWSEPVNGRQLLARVPRWANQVRSLLDAAEDWRGRPLYRLPPLRSWSAGRVALIGDAAHPLLPHLAQGAALAIEDAATLAQCFNTKGNNIAAAFQQYQRLRRRRVRRVQLHSERLGQLYHLHGPDRVVRNFVLKRRRPMPLLRQLDWLYGKTPADL